MIISTKDNWYKIAARSIRQHIKDTINADLNSPIFITEKHEIIDGAHRTAKAYILGKKVNAIILTQKDLDKTLLPEDTDYVGQIYRDDEKNEYSVTKLIELYADRPTTVFNPEVILKESQNVWGKVSIADIIRQTKELLKNKKIKTANNNLPQDDFVNRLMGKFSYLTFDQAASMASLTPRQASEKARSLHPELEKAARKGVGSKEYAHIYRDITALLWVSVNKNG